ncbi:hypothetical protein C0991_011743, partial [Blastosporella zonata]
MFVVDKMVAEDTAGEVDAAQLLQVRLPNGMTKPLGPSAMDAFSVFEDLCLLANSKKPHFLKLESLHKTFALGLIKSILTNYHVHFRKHAKLVLLLQHYLCPLLLKALSDCPIFPLTLQCTRVVFLLLKQFSSKLTTESEVFLILLIKIFLLVLNSKSINGGAKGCIAVLLLCVCLKVTLGATLVSHGYKLQTNGTDNHLILWDLRPSKVEKVCNLMGITINKNAVSGNASAQVPGGIHIGTSALTSRNMREEEMKIVANFLHCTVQLLLHLQKEADSKLLKDFVCIATNQEEGKTGFAQVKQLRDEVRAFASQWPLPGVDVLMLTKPDIVQILGATQ